MPALTLIAARDRALQCLHAAPVSDPRPNKFAIALVIPHLFLRRAFQRLQSRAVRKYGDRHVTFFIRVRD
jgi:hypothetical protein